MVELLLSTGTFIHLVHKLFIECLLHTSDTGEDELHSQPPPQNLSVGNGAEDRIIQDCAMTKGSQSAPRAVRRSAPEKGVICAEFKGQMEAD